MKPSLTRNRVQGRADAGHLRVALSSDPDSAELVAWDRLVHAAPGSDVAQLSSWARFRGSYGYRPLYLFVFGNETLLGGAQILHRRLPAIGEIGYVPHGPVTGPDHTEPELLEVICRALADLARHRFRMMFVQPPHRADAATLHLTALGFRPSTADLAPPGSLRLDLRQSEDELRKALNRNIRRWVTKWHALGVEVRLGDRSDIPLLARLLADTAAHQGFDPLGESYAQRLYDELAATGHAALFVGEVHGRPVAAALVTMCGSTVNIRLGGMDRSADAGHLQVPAAVQWEIVRWAKSNGYRWYDLGGMSERPLRTLVDGEPGDHSTWSGADRYKLQFGGTAYRYPTPVEMIRPWPFRIAYDLSRRFPAGRTIIRRATQRLRGGRRRGQMGPARCGRVSTSPDIRDGE